MTRLPAQRSWVMLAALAVASAACQYAHAEAHAKVSLSNHQYTLTDLDLDDGIDPSVTWSSGVLTQSVWGSTSSGVGYGGAPNSTGSDSILRTYEVPLGTPRSNTYQGFTAASDAEGLKASVDITTGGGSWGVSSQYDQVFMLGANTAITFTATAETQLGVVVPPDSVVQGPYGVQNGYFDWAPIQASATALIAVGDQPASAPGGSPCWGDSCRFMDYSDDWLRSYQTVHQVQGSALSLTFRNESNAALSKTLSTMVYTDGYATAPLTMVPEPSAWAMWGLGLGVLSLTTSRRRKPTRRA